VYFAVCSIPLNAPNCRRRGCGRLYSASPSTAAALPQKAPRLPDENRFVQRRERDRRRRGPISRTVRQTASTCVRETKVSASWWQPPIAMVSRANRRPLIAPRKSQSDWPKSLPRPRRRRPNATFIGQRARRRSAPMLRPWPAIGWITLRRPVADQRQPLADKRAREWDEGRVREGGIEGENAGRGQAKGG